MMNNTLKRLSSLTLIFAAAFLIQKCSEDSVNPNSSYVSGTVNYTSGNFADTTASGYYYSVAAYWADSVDSGPRHWQSTPSAVFNMTINEAARTGYFKISNLASGNYYIAAVAIRRSTNCIIGLQGVDSSGVASPPHPITIVFPDYSGNGGENFSAVPIGYISGYGFSCP